MKQEIVISTKQATEYLLSRSGITQRRFKTQTQAVQKIYRRVRPSLSQGFAVFAVVVLVGFSGTMAGFTQQNASRVMAQTGNREAAISDATSAYVAANVANGLGISLASQVNEHSESLSAQSQLLASDEAYMRKASAVATDSLSFRNVQTYTVQSGESIGDIAKKFGITSDTIRWANDIAAGGGVSTGDKLTILPVDGVLHTVSGGDTPDSLASYYKASAAQIISFNDAEVKGLRSGQKIVVPGGTKPAEYSPASGYFASAFVPQYSGNGYVYGYCTWYVASRINVPSNWGNASTWAANAAVSGWNVSSTPTVGSIAQNSWMAWGLGHVGVVEEVSPDGRRIKLTDMNGNCGWGCVGTAWVPTSTYSAYISR